MDVVGFGTTVIVGVVARVALQFVGVIPVAKILKVVVDVKFPVGRTIGPPDPATADPTSALPVLFLS